MSNVGNQTELIERLRNTVKELYTLLEHYAPVWYTDELRQKAEATLQMLESQQSETADSDLQMKQHE